MTVVVAGRRLSHIGQLSKIAQGVLGLVGGVDWLKMALGDASLVIDEPDETALVSALQEQLHGSALVALPRSGLRISPVKLMTLGRPRSRR